MSPSRKLLLSLLVLSIGYISFNSRKFFTTVPFELVSLVSLVFILCASFNIKLYIVYVEYENEILAFHIFSTYLYIFKSILYVVVKSFPMIGTHRNEYYYNMLLTSIGGLILTTGLLTYLLNLLLEKLPLIRQKSLNGWETLTDISLGNNIVKVKWATTMSVYCSKLAILYQLVLMMVYWKFSITRKTLSGPRFFIDPNYYYLITASMLAVSYYLLSTWKLIMFKCFYSTLNMKLKIILSTFAASKTKFDNEICTICLDENPTIHFCLDHCFHEHCLIGYLYSKGKLLLSNSLMMPNTNSSSHSSQKLIISKQELPSCPACRRNFSRNEIKVKIKHGYKWVYVDIEPTERDLISVYFEEFLRPFNRQLNLI